jgi:hypothetical protein
VEILAAVRPLGPVRSWAGLGVARAGGPTWPLGCWVWWPVVTPTGTGTGSSAPPPHRRLAAGGLRPRVFPAHRPGPQLQVHAYMPGMGRYANPLRQPERLLPSDRPKLPSHAHFHSLAIRTPAKK